MPEASPPVGKYLTVLDNGDHYLGGIAAADANSGVPEQRQAVPELTLAVLDAHVTNDAAAKAWLVTITDQVGSCPVLFRRK